MTFSALTKNRCGWKCLCAHVTNLAGANHLNVNFMLMVKRKFIVF